MISLNTSIENTVSPYQLELMTFCSCCVGCWVGKVVGIFQRENKKVSTVVAALRGGSVMHKLDN